MSAPTAAQVQQALRALGQVRPVVRAWQNQGPGVGRPIDVLDRAMPAVAGHLEGIAGGEDVEQHVELALGLVDGAMVEWEIEAKRDLSPEFIPPHGRVTGCANFDLRAIREEVAAVLTAVGEQ